LSKLSHITLLITLLFCSAYNLSAQNYVQKNFTIKDGLPSNEIYCALQDSEGKMWFGTDAGLSVFNGFYFKNYTIKDGLLDNSIFAMQMDEKGRIWFGTLNRQVFYFENGEFKPAITKSGDTILIPKREILEIKVTKDAVYYCTSPNTFKIVEKNNAFEMQWLGVNTKEEYDFTIEQIDEKQVCLANRLLSFNYNDYKISVNVKGYKKVYKFKGDIHKLNSGFWTLSVADSCILVSSAKTIIQLFKNGNAKVTVHNDEILKAKITDNVFYSQTRQGGIKPYKLNYLATSYSERILFDGYTISSYLFDSEKGFWATSLESGIFYSTVLSNEIYTFDAEANYNIVQLDTLVGEVWIVNKAGVLMRSKEFELNKNVVKRELIGSNEIKNVYDIELYDKHLVVSSAGQTKLFEYNGKEFEVKKRLNKPFRILSNVKRELLYGGTRDSIYEIKNFKSKLYINKKFNEIFSLYNAGDSLLIGSNQGLDVYKKGRLVHYPLLINFNERVQVIKRNSFNTYVLGTKSSGVIFLSNKETISITTEQGLISNNITDVLCTNDTTTWVASKFGLSKIVFTYSGKYKIENFNNSSGLLFDNVTSLACNNGLLYVGTADGFFAINENELKINEILPKVILEKIVSLKTGKQDNVYEYDNNDIKIFISVNTFRNFGKVNARYKLKSDDTTYYYTTVKDGELTLLHLESGNYEFSIEVANNSGVWSKPLAVNFEIKTPYWRKTWFIVLCSLLFLVISALIFIVRLKAITKRNKEKASLELQLEELKNKALRLQMNPHFLFNALNAIQGYYASGEAAKAKLYIYNLSNLLRQILENTKKDTITLEMEIQLITYYLELNKLRFEKEFNYEIDVKDDLLPYEILVPPLITQPFIENAFVHGLSTLTKNGLITIDVKKENELLQIEIIDNGIGRKASEMLNRDLKHESMGIQVTKDRIGLVSKKEVKSLEIIDLYENEIAIGTKVIIRIPLNYNI